MPDRHLLFCLIKKVNKTACRLSFSGGAKSRKNHPSLSQSFSGAKPAFTHNTDSYRYQARGHFFGPPRFGLFFIHSFIVLIIP
jgi:hypothetical protein